MAASEGKKVRELVLRFGWNSSCYQLMNPGFNYWFSNHHDAAIAYVNYAGTRVVAGAPVCAFDNLLDVVNEFELDSATNALQVCYFASSNRLKNITDQRKGYSTIHIGAQPVWRPHSLTKRMYSKKSLKHQLHRAARHNVVIEEWSSNKATEHPLLLKILDNWLTTRGLPRLHFLVESKTLSHLNDRRIFVAIQREQVVGFLIASPIPGRNGWLIEQFIRKHDAPNGTVELMLQHAAQAFANEKFDYLTLGLAPLTSQAKNKLHNEPWIIRLLLYWAKAHGSRFYNFEGLEFFKTKFEPDYWEPLYAIANKPQFSIRTLYAISCAFTHGRPLRTLFFGLLKDALILRR